MNRPQSWDNANLVHAARVDNLRHDCHFITTNDSIVWVDTPKESAIAAAYKNDESIGKTIPFDWVENVSWTTIQILPGFEARIKGTEESKIGDTPGEAAKHLEFQNIHELDRPPITEESSITTQIEDILAHFNGAVHVETVETFINRETLQEEVPESLTDWMLQNEDTSNIYRTRGEDPNWWTVRR